MIRSLGAILLLVSALTSAEPIRKASAHDVATTIDRLQSTVEAKGMAVFARIDHQKGAKEVGLEMNEAQVLIFGNPNVGTLIMQDNPAAALDLPIRILAYEDDAGATWVLYHDPESLCERYGLDSCTVAGKMKAALDGLTDGVIAGD